MTEKKTWPDLRIIKLREEQNTVFPRYLSSILSLSYLFSVNANICSKIVHVDNKVQILKKLFY